MGSDRTATRREFLRWMGLAPGAAAALASGAAVLRCGNANGASAAPRDADASGDSGGGGLDLASEAGVGDAGGGGGDLGGGVCEPTASDIQGPYFLEGAPRRAVLAGVGEPGERLSISGVVYGPDCETPLRGALLDVWQADATGAYHADTDTYRLRGQLLTDDDGAFAFETIRPGHYPLGAGMRPAHIHFTVTAPGHRSLTTQLYFAGDPWLAPADPCGVCNSEDDTLIIALEQDEGGAVGSDAAWRGRFDIVMRRV
jgi:catechol 1,2-dioxygenase